jgi:ABC-type multidrug transport system fused ATPase/permease subunit
LAVVGPSGAGKSSLVNVLLRLWDYESGKIELGGHELKSYSMQDLRSVFSLVAQSNHVFSATVRQNLALANPSAGEQQMAESIGFVGLADWLASLPQGLDSWLGENGVKMSAGERQRLIIARTILQSAPLLICDEPTAHLDPITEKLILGNLLEFCHNKSLIWVTHRLIGLEKMDEIIVLQAGRIIERGNHALLVKNGGIYQRMWEIQNRVILGA